MNHSIAPSTKKQWVFNLLSLVVAKRPQRIRRLLQKHGVNTSNQIERKALFQKVITATHSQTTDFQLELAILLAEQVPQFQKSPRSSTNKHKKENDYYHSFNPDQPEDAYAGLILGAVSEIAGAVGKIKTKKQRRAEASQELLSNIMQTRAYQAQQAKQLQQAQIATQNTAQNAAWQAARKKANSKQMKLAISIGGIRFIGLVIVWFMYQNSQDHEKQL